MANADDGDSKPFPEMGLQFDPTQDVGVGPNQSMNNPPTTPIGESQEVMFGNAGHAILVGDETDLESDRVCHPSASHDPSKGGLMPNWLKSSSPKMKALLGLTAIVLLAFVAVMIVGVLQLPAPADKNDGISSIETDENIATDPETTTAQPRPASSAEPSPAPTSYSPSQEIMYIPISESEIDVLFPPYLEMIVPDFSNGLSSAEEENWNTIEGILESTISTSLSESLPEDYPVESIQVDEFDGYVTSSIRKQRRREGMRHLKDDKETIHSVVYSSSVKVNCLETDCSTAASTVASVTSELAEMEYLTVSADVVAPIESNIIASAPTKRPTISTPAPVTTETPQPTEGTNKPTSASPTLRPTPTPVVNSVIGPVSLSEAICDAANPCDMCFGSCSSDDECQEGLFCFQRRGYDFIPGCEGPGKPGQSYCYDPFADGLTKDDLLSIEDDNCDKKDRCEKCQGDCDEDEDCAKNLFCFKRSEFEQVPGCAGQGTFGTDYCFDPNDLEGIGDYI